MELSHPNNEQESVELAKHIFASDIEPIFKEFSNNPGQLAAQLSEKMQELIAQDGRVDLSSDKWKAHCASYLYFLTAQELQMYPVLLETFLIKAWNDFGMTQKTSAISITRGIIGIGLVMNYLRRNDHGAALRWALLTLASDVLENNTSGQGEQTLHILGVPSEIITIVTKYAQSCRVKIENEHNNDWSRPLGFAENIVTEAASQLKFANLFTLPTQVREFPVSPGYLNSLLDEANKPHSAHQKGKSLENIAAYLTTLIPGWIVLRNSKPDDNTSETDIVVSDLSHLPSTRTNLIGSQFIIECKNLKEKANVSQIGYFLYRMKLTHTHFGIIFSPQGITGDHSDSEKAASGLIRRAYHEDGLTCIYFDSHDLEDLKTGTVTFWGLIVEKSLSLSFGRSHSQINLE